MIPRCNLHNTSGPQVADPARRRPEGDGLPPQVFAFAQQLQPRREGRRQERGDQDRIRRGHGRADKPLILTGYCLHHIKNPFKIYGNYSPPPPKGTQGHT